MKKFLEWLDELLEFGGMKKNVLFLVLSGIGLLLSILKVPMPFDGAWIAIILCGVPIILEALIGLLERFDIRSGVLVSIALVAAVCVGEDFAAGEVAFIMQLGELLEHVTVSKARSGIEKLVKLSPDTARVVRDGNEITVMAKDVAVGDIVKVLPGEIIPVDGTVVSGNTTVDESVMTGESLPVDKVEGSVVSSGTLNQMGAFSMRADRVGIDSSIQRMIRLVKNADASRAKIVGIADRWATWIVVIAVLAALAVYVFTSQIIRAVSILVVFCPCALVLATPTAIMAAIGNASKHGFLVREGDALERLSAVDTIAFDKTGTLTLGLPYVREVVSIGDLSDDEVYRLCAGVEQYSEHPLGKAVVRCYKAEKEGVLPESFDFEMYLSRGVSAVVDGKNVTAGNLSFVEDKLISQQLEEKTKEYYNKGCAVIFVIVDGVPQGFVVLSDEIRGDSKETVAALKRMNMQPVLISGDVKNAADDIAEKAGIEQVHGNCRPEDKMEIIGKLQAEGHKVCMTGDGINDAPSLKKADVGIAMGGIGSDIAVENADIVLTGDDIRQLPHLVKLSRHMMKTVRLNIAFSMGLNFLAIILAATGLLSPVVGALVHNAGSVAVIINSAMLLVYKGK